MREFKNEQIVFYCNCCGELHRGGKEMLQQVEDLPLPLQSVYKTYWTDNLTAPCYIAYVDDRPGLLIAAEYNDEECDLQNIPHDHDAKYAVLCERGERLEQLIKSVSDTAEVGIGVDTGFDLELMLFIPTQEISEMEILRLYYLIDEFAFSNPPDKIVWDECNDQLLALVNRSIFSDDMRDKLVVQLTNKAEE